MFMVEIKTPLDRYMLKSQFLISQGTNQCRHYSGIYGDHIAHLLLGITIVGSTLKELRLKQELFVTDSPLGISILYLLIFQCEKYNYSMICNRNCGTNLSTTCVERIYLFFLDYIITFDLIIASF